MSGQGSALAALRARIARTERGDLADAVLPFGLEVVDAALPGGGLPLGALHEVSSPPADPAGMAFVLALAARLQRLERARGQPPVAVLWCQSRTAEGEAGTLYGPGLAQMGLDTSRLVLARPANLRGVFWAMEEGLRSGAASIVVGAGVEADLVAGRRLQLAAAATGALAFLLPPPRGHLPPSPAISRWRVASAPAPERCRRTDILPAGPIRWPAFWRAALLRYRGGRPVSGSWILSWSVRKGEFQAE